MTKTQSFSLPGATVFLARCLRRTPSGRPNRQRQFVQDAIEHELKLRAKAALRALGLSDKLI